MDDARLVPVKLSDDALRCGTAAEDDRLTARDRVVIENVDVAEAFTPPAMLLLDAFFSFREEKTAEMEGVRPLFGFIIIASGR